MLARTLSVSLNLSLAAPTRLGSELIIWLNSGSNLSTLGLRVVTHSACLAGAFVSRSLCICDSISSAIPEAEKYQKLGMNSARRSILFSVEASLLIGRFRCPTSPVIAPVEFCSAYSGADHTVRIGEQTCAQ